MISAFSSVSRWRPPIQLSLFNLTSATLSFSPPRILSAKVHVSLLGKKQPFIQIPGNALDGVNMCTCTCQASTSNPLPCGHAQWFDWLKQDQYSCLQSISLLTFVFPLIQGSQTIDTVLSVSAVLASWPWSLLSITVH